MATTQADAGPHRGARIARWLALPLLVVGGGVVGGLIAHAVDQPAAPAASRAAAGCPITRVAEDNLKSVVTITARSATSGGTGSGEIISSDGYIVTNNHVVLPAASGGNVEVLFDNGTTAAARIVGRDPVADLAVIKVDVGRPLPPIRFGSSSTVRIGEQVVALGAPLGLSSTVTSGIVSALDRTVQVPGEGAQTALLIDAIQTDAAINPGNSGGALLNCDGALIGIPSAGATVPTTSGESSGGSIGLGFAIPVDLVKEETRQIIATGRVQHAYLGLQAEPLPANADGQAGSSAGLYVTTVTAGGPAERAGIKAGDTILALDGKTVVSTDALVALTLKKAPGTTVNVEYQQDGRRASARVVLSASP